VADPHPPTPRSSDVITRTELATVRGTTQNAYSAVERLRPLFLATRPGSGILSGTTPRIHVFIDGSLAGGIETLEMMPLATVASIQRVRATTAFTQFRRVESGDVVLMVITVQATRRER